MLLTCALEIPQAPENPHKCLGRGLDVANRMSDTAEGTSLASDLWVSSQSIRYCYGLQFKWFVCEDCNKNVWGICSEHFKH